MFAELCSGCRENDLPGYTSLVIFQFEDKRMDQRVTQRADIIRNPGLEQAAAALYDPRLPYHNFSHALEVLTVGNEYIGRCREADMPIEVDVVYPALLFHDAGYQTDHRVRGFDSKEAYSAELAGSVMHSYQYASGVIAAVQRAIISTQCGIPCETTEAKLVKAADLSGLAADYPLFLQNAMRLWREEAVLSRRLTEWEQWRDNAIEMVERFLTEDLGFSPACYADDGEAWLNKQARANVDRLRSQPNPDNV